MMQPAGCQPAVHCIKILMILFCFNAKINLLYWTRYSSYRCIVYEEGLSEKAVTKFLLVTEIVFLDFLS